MRTRQSWWITVSVIAAFLVVASGSFLFASWCPTHFVPALLVFLPLLGIAAVALALLHKARTIALELERHLQDQTASLARFSILSEHSRSIVWELDKHAQYRYVSDSIFKVLGYHPEEVVNKLYVYDLCPRGFREELKNMKQSMTEQPRELRDLDNPMMHRDGTVYSFLSYVLPNNDLDGNCCGFVGVDIDVTERRKAEERYSMLFHEMLDGFALHEMIFDDQGNPQDYRFLAVNPAFETLTGLTAATVVGRTVLEVLPATEEHWIRAYGQVVQTGESTIFENYLTALDKYFEVKAFCPEPGKFACIFTDVTSRRKAEEEKDKLQAKMTALQRMESIGRLAGGVAHDFNNMLQAIMGAAEMGAMEVGTGAGQQEFKDIIGITRRAGALPRQLLAFSSREPSESRVLQVNELIGGMQSMLRRLVGERIRVAWSPCPDPCWIKIDPSQMDQIIANLFVNARDAIKDSGTITIEVRAEKIGWDKTDLELPPGDYVVLQVDDDGHGMDESTRQRVFDPFFTTKPQGEGTGLGLPMVYGIVKQHGGVIHVYSEPGRGSSFKLYFPRCSSSGEVQQSTTIASDAEGSVGKGECVLLVEDEVSVRKVAERMLASMGYRVLTADSSEEAMRLVETTHEKIDLLITDVVMPGMNGKTLVHWMRDRDPSVPCLLMSGYSRHLPGKDAQIEEGDAFLQKPFSSIALSIMVHRCLETHRSRAKDKTDDNGKANA